MSDAANVFFQPQQQKLKKTIFFADNEILADNSANIRYGLLGKSATVGAGVFQALWRRSANDVSKSALTYFNQHQQNAPSTPNSLAILRSPQVESTTIPHSITPAISSQNSPGESPQGASAAPHAAAVVHTSSVEKEELLKGFAEDDSASDVSDDSGFGNSGVDLGRTYHSRDQDPNPTTPTKDSSAGRGILADRWAEVEAMLSRRLAPSTPMSACTAREPSSQELYVLIGEELSALREELGLGIYRGETARN